MICRRCMAPSPPGVRDLSASTSDYVWLCHLCARDFEICNGYKFGSNQLTFISGKMYAASKWPTCNEIVTPVDDSPTESESASLMLMWERKHWKVEYSRLERLINKGWVNSTGTELTDAGCKMIGMVR